MMIFQVLVLNGDTSEVDREDALYSMTTPNPCFASLAGATRYVLGDINQLRKEFNEDEAEEDHIPLLESIELEWRVMNDGRTMCRTFKDEDGAGNLYLLAEVPLLN